MDGDGDGMGVLQRERTNGYKTCWFKQMRLSGIAEVFRALIRKTGKRFKSIGMLLSVNVKFMN